VNLSSAAVSNTFEEDTNAPYGNVNNWQINRAAVNASTTANLSSIGGSATASATAIGNTGQIIHYAIGN
jgi:shikimate kinase